MLTKAVKMTKLFGRNRRQQKSDKQKVGRAHVQFSFGSTSGKDVDT